MDPATCALAQCDNEEPHVGHIVTPEEGEPTVCLGVEYEPAVVEEAPIFALTIDTLDRDNAVYRSPNMLVTLTRTDWLQRGRPETIYVHIADQHPANG